MPNFSCRLARAWRYLYSALLLFCTLALADSTLRAQASAPALTFTSTAVGGSASGTVKFTFTSQAMVSSIVVSTQGATGLDFQASSQAASGNCSVQTYTTSNNSCQVAVTFTPRAAGLRSGAVVLYDASYNIIGQAYLSGTGLAGLPIVATGPENTLSGPTGLSTPFQLTVDAAGTLYAGSTANGTVYKEVPGSGGTFTQTMVTTGLSSVAQLLADGAGNLLILDSSASKLYKEILNPSTLGYTQSTLTLNPAVSGSSGVALDGAGDLYVSFPSTGTVYKYSINPNTGSYTTGKQIVSGLGTAYLQVDAAGNLYIADATNGNLIKETYSSSTNTYTASTIVSGLTDPNGLALDPTGGVYVSTTNGVYHYYVASGSSVYTGVTVFASSIATPNGVAVSSTGVVYVSGGSTNLLYAVNQTTTSYAAAGTTAVGSTSAAQNSTLLNNGNASTSESSAAATPPAAAGSGATCLGATIASNATCVLPIVFAPATHGASPQSGRLVDSFTVPGGSTTLSTVVQTVTGYVTGDPVKLAITTAPTGSVAAGNSPGQLAATLQDANGVTAAYDTTASVTLTVTYPDNSVTTSSANAVNSVATFTLPALNKAGTYTYAVTSSGLAGASTTSAVTAGPASSLVVTLAPSNYLYVKQQATVTVTAQDAQGNAATSDNDTVRLTTDDTTATLPPNFALVSGTGTQTVSFGQTGSFSLTATDTSNASIRGILGPIAISLLPSYTVTVGTDDSASASGAQCSNQSASGATLDANCSLPDAVAATNALNLTGTGNAVPTISFAASLNGSSLMLGAALSPTANVNIAGPGAALVAILPTTAYSYNAVNARTANTVFTLSGLTVNSFGLAGSGGAALLFTGTNQVVSLVNDSLNNNGGSPSGTSFSTNGGAVYAIGGTLNVSGSIFTGNTAASGGGAIYAYSENLTITGSSFGNQAAPNRSTAGSGGALYLHFTPASIGTSTFSYNQAYSGGGIYSDSGLSLSGDVFLNNVANLVAGGAVNCTAGLTVTGSTFNNNTAVSYGGAIYTTSQFSISTSSFSSNQATGSSSNSLGGAVYGLYNTASNVIGNTNFIGNDAVNAANGIALGGAVYAARLTINNTLFAGNFTSNPKGGSSEGGAVYLTGAYSSVFTGSTFTGNNNQDPSGGTVASNQYGGAVYLTTANSSLSLYGDTISGNASRTAGGAYVNAGMLSLYNTALSGNTASLNYTDTNVSPAFDDSYFNSHAGVVCNPSNPATGCTPMLSALGSFGGGTVGAAGYTTPVMTLIPLPGSPLLAAGDTAALNGATTDARGAGYPRTLVESGATHVDIGAAEANYALAYVQQPGNVEVNQKQTATVQLYESGKVLMPGSTGGAIAEADADSYGTGSAALAVTGLETVTETYSTAATGDTLTSSVQSSASPVVTVASVTSSPFNIINPSTATLAGLRFTAYPGNTPTGIAQTVTLTAVDSGGAPYAAYTGTVTFTSSDAFANLPAAYTFTAADAGSHTFSLALNTGGTESLSVSDGTYSATQTGIVTTGYVWLVDNTAVLTKDYANGTAISSSSGYSGGSPTTGLAFDSASNAWSLNGRNSTLVEFNQAGTSLSGNGFSGGGLNAPYLLAIDGTGKVWITNSNAGLSLFSNAGVALSPSTGFTGVTSSGTGYSQPSGIAIDASGNVWVANAASNTLTEVLGAAAPVAPLSTALTNNTTGARP